VVNGTVFQPDHAMVLAAGLGQRMRPLTLERPKPLLTVAGRSLLDHALDRIEAAGIPQAVVNAHYKAEMIATAVASRTRPAIRLSPEAEALETGGGIRQALPDLGSLPFLVVNADILWLDGAVPAIHRLAAAWDPHHMDALLLLMPVAEAHGYDGRGDFFLEESGLDESGRLRRRGPEQEAPLVFAGVHLTTPALYHDTPEGPFSSNLVWDRALAAGRLHGLIHDGAWFHVGTPDALAATNRWFADHPDALPRPADTRP